MGELSNNPMSLEQYNSINPSDIRSGGFTIQNLITRQLERVDFLLTLGTAKINQGSQYFDENQMAQATKRGLRSVESYLSPFLEDDEEYKTKAKQYKAQLDSILSERVVTDENKKNQIFNTLALWQDLLVSRMGNIDLLPQKRTEIEFD